MHMILLSALRTLRVVRRSHEANFTFVIAHLLPMPRCLTTAICLPFVGRCNRGTRASNHGSKHSSTHRISIHILNDDVLLNIFYLYRPMLINEIENLPEGLVEPELWNKERWWCKLVHVCQRWRYLILSSASHLRLHLLCTYGTPVADMLAHSPPLPIIIEHFDRHHDITTEDEEGIGLALRHRDRVRSIRLMLPFLSLQKFIEAVDDEFPILECLCIAEHDSA
ncbi:hypothetical protein BJV74DRAFT_627137 [Russula compacta]|nr:hypothetical protein BJV74DRAFT_627137 [Russula compacta]